MSEEIINDDEQDDALFEHHRIVVDPKQGLVRLDKFLMDRLPNVTRTKIQGGITEGFIKVNEKEVKSNYRVHPGDVITVSLPEPPRDSDVVPENIPLNIVFEDPWLMIINKPAGMVVHPAYQNWSGTVGLRLMLSRWTAMEAQYSSYGHHFDQGVQLAPGVVSGLKRQGLRVSFTWLLPVLP